MSSRKILKIGLRKRTEIPITLIEDQEEQYYQNLNEYEDQLFFEFKRMRISEETDEFICYLKKNKQQQQGENFMLLYESNLPIMKEKINSRSTHSSVDLQEGQIIENITVVSSEQTLEQFNIIKIDEIDYVKKLSFLKKQTCQKTNKFQSKTFKKAKHDKLPFRNKLIQK